MIALSEIHVRLERLVERMGLDHYSVVYKTEPAGLSPLERLLIPCRFIVAPVSRLLFMHWIQSTKGPAQHIRWDTLYTPRQIMRIANQVWKQLNDK